MREQRIESNQKHSKGLNDPLTKGSTRLCVAPLLLVLSTQRGFQRFTNRENRLHSVSYLLNNGPGILQTVSSSVIYSVASTKKQQDFVKELLPGLFGLITTYHTWLFFFLYKKKGFFLDNFLLLSITCCKKCFNPSKGESLTFLTANKEIIGNTSVVSKRGNRLLFSNFHSARDDKPNTVLFRSLESESGFPPFQSATVSQKFSNSQKKCPNDYLVCSYSPSSSF